MVSRRCSGEPLAWLIGHVLFCNETVQVHPGVYVPRPQSEPLALAAAGCLPPTGVAVDLCTGSGAIAVVLARRRPVARVVASEVDPLAIACAKANGVEVFDSDVALGLPDNLIGTVDVVTGVVPYVPTGAMHLLARDVLAFEPRQALDGGASGLDFLRRAVDAAVTLLRPGGSLFLELGGDEADGIEAMVVARGFSHVEWFFDEHGDVRGVSCQR
jgi:release factor glutamine methyltransferase